MSSSASIEDVVEGVRIVWDAEAVEVADACFVDLALIFFWAAWVDAEHVGLLTLCPSMEAVDNPAAGLSFAVQPVGMGGHSRGTTHREVYHEGNELVGHVHSAGS
jgi:hypothetical protein